MKRRRPSRGYKAPSSRGVSPRSKVELENLTEGVALLEIEPDLATFNIHANDTLVDCLWKVMLDYKDRSILGLIRELRATRYTPEQIREGLESMVKHGALVCDNKASDLKRTYKLHRNYTVPPHLFVVPEDSEIGNDMSIKDLAELKALLQANNIDASVASTPTLKETPMSRTNTQHQIAAPINFNAGLVIQLSDGLDLSIWKLMSDRKPRPANMIAELLFTYGFARDVVRQRAISLFRKGWFDQSGKGANTQYTMRKTIKAPETSTPTVHQVMGYHNKSADHGMMQKLGRETKGTATKDGMPSSAGRDYSTTATAASEPKQQTLTGLVEKSFVATPAARIMPTISADDTFEQAVWKVMSDYHAYTPAELVLLMADLRWTANTIATKLGILHLHNGWFNRVKAGRSFSYTLKADIPMPTQELVTPTPPNEVKLNPSVQRHQDTIDNIKQSLNEHAAKQQSKEPMNATNIQSQNIQQDAAVNSAGYQAIPSALVAGVISQPPALLDITIRIKGLEFSLEDAKTIGRELHDSGFGKDELDPENAKPMLIQLHIRVKDVDLTATEADQLARKLLKAGLV